MRLPHSTPNPGGRDAAPPRQAEMPDATSQPRPRAHPWRLGLRWQAKRDTAFARPQPRSNPKTSRPPESAVAAALCRRSPRRFAPDHSSTRAALRIPTGFRPPAQGRDAGATLGQRTHISPTPTGLPSVRAHTNHRSHEATVGVAERTEILLALSLITLFPGGRDAALYVRHGCLTLQRPWFRVFHLQPSNHRLGAGDELQRQSPGIA
jgi:hypothetical protein